MNAKILERLEHLGLDLHGGASIEAIAAVEGRIGLDFVGDLKFLYRKHNGQDPCQYWDYRLMTLEEVLETYDALRGIEQYQAFHDELGLVFFWSNDNSDYLGVCLREPFRGLIAMLDHDGEPFRFIYRSFDHLYSDLIESHVAALVEAGEYESGSRFPWLMHLLTLFRPRRRDDDAVKAELNRFYISDGAGGFRPPRDSGELVYAKQNRNAWIRLSEFYKPSGSVTSFRDLPSDFAAYGLIPCESVLPIDRERAAKLHEMMGDPAMEEVASHVATALCGVTPEEDSDQLIPLLDHDDFYVAETTATSLGLRHWAPAAEKIRWLVKHGISNARYAAAKAIRRIDPPAPMEEILAELRTTDPHHRGFFDLLLDDIQRHGYEVIQRWHGHGPEDVRFRKEGTEEWRGVG